MRFRFILLGLAVIVSGLGLLVSPGCSESPAGRSIGPEGRVVIEFWHAMGREQGAEVNRIASQFNASQETYFVQPVYQGQYNALSQKLIASLYARRNPAISQMYPSWSSRFHRYEFLRPMNEFIAEDPEFGQEDLDDFYPVMIEENTIVNPETGEAELVSLPFNKSVYVLFINQTRMQELGRTAPETWEELEDLARAMTVIPEGATQPTVFGIASRPFIEELTVQALAAGSHLLDEETGDILISSEPVREAFTFIRRLVSGEGNGQVGYVETDYLSNVFGSGRINMYVGSTAAFTFNDIAVGGNFEWRAYPVPARDPETQGMTLMQGTNLGIFGNVPEEQQQGAWEFVKFMVSPEINAQWAMSTGYMPVRRSISDLPQFAEHMQQNRSFANAISTLETAAYEPRLIYWESVRQLISRQVEAVLLGRMSVDDAIASSERAIREMQRGTASR